MAAQTSIEELIVDYAAGAVSLGAAAALEAHFEMRPEAARGLDLLDPIGGEAIETAAPEPLAVCSVDLLEAAPSSPAKAAPTGDDLPRALQRIFPPSEGPPRWKKVWPGLEHARSALAPSAFLFRARPGLHLPRHRHVGQELTLVLSGGFTDDGARFGPGDIVVADETTEHRFIIDPDEPCVCFAAVDGDVRLSGPFGAALSLIGVKGL